ncbi:MAG: F0F1 ATP synthase subunit B [Paludibacter sp.]
MSLLVPDTGLLIWMLLVFGVVVFVLAKYGFPVIIKMVEDRKAFIEESLLMAEQARKELQQVKAEGEEVLALARKEQQSILNDAARLREKMIADARSSALVEADKVIKEARVQIEHEKQEAIKEIRLQVATLSVNVAEKIMRSKLEVKGEQEKMIERLLDEIKIS